MNYKQIRACFTQLIFSLHRKQPYQNVLLFTFEFQVSWADLKHKNNLVYSFFYFNKLNY